jgi:hypothetical protein
MQRGIEHREGGRSIVAYLFLTEPYRGVIVHIDPD